MNIDTNNPTWGAFECEGILDVIAKHCTLENAEDDNGNKWTRIGEFDHRNAVADVLGMPKGLESIYCLMTAGEQGELAARFLITDAFPGIANYRCHKDLFYACAGRALERLMKSEERDIELIVKNRLDEQFSPPDKFDDPEIFVRKQAF